MHPTLHLFKFMAFFPLIIVIYIIHTQTVKYIDPICSVHIILFGYMFLGPTTWYQITIVLFPGEKNISLTLRILGRL